MATAGSVTVTEASGALVGAAGALGRLTVEGGKTGATPCGRRGGSWEGRTVGRGGRGARPGRLRGGRGARGGNPADGRDKSEKEAGRKS